MLSGVIEAAALPKLLQNDGAQSAGEVARHDFEVAGELTAFFELLSKPGVRQSGLVLVASRNNSVLAKEIMGVISAQRVSEVMMQAFTPSAE